MRSDMAKVAVERPRHRAYGERKGRWVSLERNVSEESAELLPKGQGMLQAHSARKSFNDHLGPLQKFLGRRIGRRWDDVHSEVCAVVKGRSTVLQHVLGHVEDFVLRHVQFDERGKPVSGTTGRGWRRRLYPGQMYVDRNGFLRRMPFKARPRRERTEWGLPMVLEIVNRGLADARMEVREGQLWRVHRDALTGSWTVRNVATERHAERDALVLLRAGEAGTLLFHLLQCDGTNAYIGPLRERLAALREGNGGRR